jgi:exosome complex RNA-binding protein Csl4
MANKVLKGAMKVVYNGERYIIHPETEIDEIEGYSDDVNERLANNIVKRLSNQFLRDEIFSKGVITFETDTGIVKFADGITSYGNLPIAAGRNPKVSNVEGLETYITDAIADATINGAKINNTISSAKIPANNVTGLSGVIGSAITQSTIDASKVRGTLHSANIASSNIVGGLDASKINGTLSAASIASSNVIGSLDASKINGTLSAASIDSGRIIGLANAIDSQVNISTIKGSQIVNTLTSAKIPASNVEGQLTNASISGYKITDKIYGTIIDGTLTNATISGNNVSGGTIKAGVSAPSVTGSLENATIPSDLKVFVKAAFSDIEYTGNGNLRDVLTNIINKMVLKPLLMSTNEFKVANPIVSRGQFALDTDTGILKIGDGISHYADLKYFWTGVPIIENMNFEGTSIVDIEGNIQGTVQDNSKVTHAHIEFTNDGGTVLANKFTVGTTAVHDSDLFFEVSSGL